MERPVHELMGSLRKVMRVGKVLERGLENMAEIGLARGLIRTSLTWVK